MKKVLAIILLGNSFLFAGTTAKAQDSSKHSAAKDISNSSEKADDLHGKKIQQQTLSSN